MGTVNFDRMADRALRMFTWVYLTAFKELNPEALTVTHIERMEQVAFDAEMCTYIVNSIADASDPLKLKYLSSLAYIKFINRETAIHGPEVDLIELANILMDNCAVMQQDKQLIADYFKALYYTVLLPFPSLFFFRSRHLFTTLEHLAANPIYNKEKNFW